VNVNVNVGRAAQRARVYVCLFAHALRLCVMREGHLQACRVFSLILRQSDSAMHTEIPILCACIRRTSLCVHALTTDEVHDFG
jgi:hypothetical protein